MITTLKQFRLILENSSYDTIMVVDIQDEYLKGINASFPLSEFAKYINDNSDKNIIFLWNGPDINGPEKSEYINWLYEIGIDENSLDYYTFFPKEYGYIRELIDYNLDRDDIASLVKFMIDNNIYDSSEIDLIKYKELFGENDIYSFFDNNTGNVGLSDSLLNFLNNQNNITLVGGNRNECLKEIEIFLQALDKNYIINEHFVY